MVERMLLTNPTFVQTFVRIVVVSYVVVKKKHTFEFVHGKFRKKTQ